MLQQVINLLQKNRLLDAQKLCEQLNHENKKNLDIWMLLADIYQRSGAPDKAEKAYRKSIKLKHDYEPAHTALAMFYHSQSKFVKAASSYQLSLKLNNQQAHIYYNLASVFQELGKYDDAIKHYKQAITLKPDYVKAYANLAYLLRQQGTTQEAISHYQKALDYAPKVAEIHYNLGLSFLDIGDTDNAEKHQLYALKLIPEYADAWAGLGAIEFYKSNLEKAEKHYQKALSIQANNIQILYGYNKVLLAAGNHKKALEYTNKAVHIESDNLLVRMTQASILSTTGQLDAALDCCKKIMKTHKGHDDAVTLAASIEEKKGNIEEAYKYLKPLLQKRPTTITAVINFASISKPLGLMDEAIAKIEDALKNADSIAITLRRKLYFTLGKLYDNQKNYDKAFTSYHKGNKLRRYNFDISSMQRDIDRQIQCFPADFQQQINASKNNSNRPIFIVGMPRSGTSLMEQIISSHPLVAAAGELSVINKLATSIPENLNSDKYYTSHLGEISSEHLNRLSQEYLEHLLSIDAEAKYITDKMPTNFMHLGFIQLLFPNAIIIHCMRDPLDTCLSCYFQDFAQVTPWVYDLQNVAQVHLEYQRVMKHWRKALSIPMLEIQYEDLVNNQEMISKNIIKFCGLEWNESCLQFHKNKRVVKTASYDQVRQPMYKKSISRWKNYEKHIKILIDTLKS